MRLRKLELKDAPLMLEWMHDETVVKDMQADFSSKTLEDCNHFILSSKDTRKNLHLAIVDENDEYMGTVSLKNIEEDKAEFAITVYNGPQEIDHLFPMNREHGKINQRKREESILCHEGNTHRNLRPRSFWRYSRESGSWEPLLRRTI